MENLFIPPSGGSKREGRSMQGLLHIVFRLSKWMNVISGVALVFMILITVADVILRSFRTPIVGTFELVAFSGAVVIGFSLPFTSWLKGHIYVDFFILGLSPGPRKIVNVVTRCLGIGLFLVIASNLLILGMELYNSGEVSPTLHLPFYLVVYGIGVCAFAQCLVLACDIIKIIGGQYE
jgi:TRAP-type C4-dicarboxylate transport system permease small subunit